MKGVWVCVQENAMHGKSDLVAFANGRDILPSLGISFSQVDFQIETLMDTDSQKHFRVHPDTGSQEYLFRWFPVAMAPQHI